jgi:hypothetical protein
MSLERLEHLLRIAMPVLFSQILSETPGGFSVEEAIAIWGDQPTHSQLAAIRELERLYGAPVEPTETPMGQGVSGDRRDTGETDDVTNPCSERYYEVQWFRNTR